MNETWQRLWTQETVVQKNCLESIPSISELFVWAIRIDLVKNDLNCFEFISALKSLSVTSQSYRYHMASMKRRPQAGRHRDARAVDSPFPERETKHLENEVRAIRCQPGQFQQIPWKLKFYKKKIYIFTVKSTGV